MITTLLWDLDGTLLNFKKAEENAIRTLFKEFNIGVLTDEMLKRYGEINKETWEKIEKNEVDKKEALIKRYERFFDEYNIDKKIAIDFNEKYQLALGDTIIYLDDSLNIVKDLKNNYKQYLVTNGTKKAQDKKIKNSHFEEVLDGVFISEEVGYDKPSIKYFDYVFNHIEEKNKDNMIIIGDSLSSDIKGGNNAGIKTCWYNPNNKNNDGDYKIDFSIKNLNEIYDVLNTLNK